MKLSASQFAREAGVSLPTVNKWIKKGRITATPTGSGGWHVDASELDRIRSHVEVVKGGQTPKGEGSETSATNPANPLETLVELATLRERCAGLARELETAKNERENAERLLSEQIDTLRQTVKLLEHYPAHKEGSAGAQNSRKGWLGRLFG